MQWSLAISRCVKELHAIGLAHGQVNPANFGVNRKSERTQELHHRD
jgi:hypothetical protein